jgi:hypothetical protein
VTVDNPADAAEFASMVRAVLARADLERPEPDVDDMDLWEAVYGSSYRPAGVSEAVADELEFKFRRKLGIAASFFVKAAEKVVAERDGRLDSIEMIRAIQKIVDEVEAEVVAWTS